MADDREHDSTSTPLAVGPDSVIGPPGEPIEEGLASHLKAALLRNQRYAQYEVPQVDVWVDRFRVVRLIGGGGMGRVFEALDPLLGRRVAIKICRSATDESIQLLAREARLLAKLSHPNVVVVHEVLEVEGELAIVMEYIEGRTLRAWANEDSPSWREVLARFDEAGCGLEAIHAAGLEHGDFKPDNVMIDAKGRVRVVDLGVARSRPAMDGDLVGTIPYMPPEQLRPIATGRVDVFAFCGSIWELVFGNRPYGLVEQLGSHTPESITKFRPPLLGAPPELVAVLRRGLSWTPEKRWQTIAEVRAALREVVRDRNEIRAQRWQWVGVGAFALTLSTTLVLAFALMAAKRQAGETPLATLPTAEPTPPVAVDGPVTVEQYLALARQEAAADTGSADEALHFIERARSRASEQADRHALLRIAIQAEAVADMLVERGQIDHADESWSIAIELFAELGDRDRSRQVKTHSVEARRLKQSQSK